MNIEEHICKTAMNVERRRSQGRAVSDDDLSFLRRHLRSCWRCRADSVAISAFESETTQSDADELAKRRLFDTVLSRAHRRPLDENDGVRAIFAENRRRYWMAAGAFAAAALLLLVLAVGSSSGPDTRPAVTSKVAATVRERLENPTDEISKGTEKRPSASGDRPSLDRLTSDAPFVGTRLDTRSTRRRIKLPTAIDLLVEPDSELTVKRMDSSAIEVALSRGGVLASVDPKRKGPFFTVSTPHGTVTVTGTVFWINASRNDVEVQVLRGSVRITRADGSTEQLSSGNACFLNDAIHHPLSTQTSEARWSEVRMLAETDEGRPETVDLSQRAMSPFAPQLPPPERQTPPSTVRSTDMPPVPLVREQPATQPVDGLLDEARRLRIERRWQASARFYEEVARLYPGTNEGTAALVTLGDLHRDKLGRPGAALAWYDAYLRSGKCTLIQEALLGKADALAQLGRPAEERAVLEVYLKRYPKTLQAAEARRRLLSLGDK